MLNTDFLRRMVLTAMLTLWSLGSFAQATMSELLEGYIEAYAHNENTTPYVTRLNQTMKVATAKEQSTLLQQLLARINALPAPEEQTTEGVRLEMSLIDLYVLLADANDNQLSNLYFQRGELCALCTGDTMRLKDCITDLRLANNSKTPEVVEYIATLQDYLEQIRSYVPTSRRLDGVWVSETVNLADRLPFYVLTIADGKVHISTIGYGNALVERTLSGKVKDYAPTIAQSVMDIGPEKVYMAWSNERMKVSNQSVVAGVSSTVGDVTGTATQSVVSSALGSSFFGDMASQMTGSIVSGVFSSLVADAFAPSKIIHLLELTLTRVNDYELTAHAVKQTIKIKGDNEPNISKAEEDIFFTRYSSDCGVYFDVPFVNSMYVPGLDYIEEIPASHQKVAEAFLKYKEVGALTHTTPTNVRPGVTNPFNLLQLRKLLYYNEQQLLRSGQPMADGYHRSTSTYIGIGFKANEKEQQAAQNAGGVYIGEIDPSSPAAMFGLLKGDILLSIDGFTVTTPEQAQVYIHSLNPYTWTSLRVKRRKQVLDIPVETTWLWKAGF